MISKKTFCETLSLIQKKAKRENEFNDAIFALTTYPNSPDYLDIYGEYEDGILNLLSEAMGLSDIKQDQLMYFVYDMNFGEDKTSQPPYIEKHDGEKKYLFTDIESLYDYLVS